MKKNKIYFLVIIFCIIAFLAIGYLKLNSKNYYEINSRIDTMKKFKKQYEETVGWLRVQGTNIDYPIILSSEVDSLDDIEYDFLWKNQNNNKLEDRTVILGHNILNVSSKPLITQKDHIRFEQLMSFVYYDFAKNNEYIQYTVNDKDYLFKIYAVTFSDRDSEISSSNLDTKKEKLKYIKKVKNNSLFDYKVNVNENDKLITLITCTRMFGSKNLKANFKVEGRLLRKNEKVNNYKVVVGSKYDKILGGKSYE